MTHDLNKQLSRGLAAIAATCAALAAGQAAAQSLSANSAELNGGWGRLQGTENAGINVRTRDANGNRLIVDGIIQTGAGASAYARSDAYGVGGVGGGGGILGGGTAIGNNLVVITQGSWNTVIIDSTQINNGDVSADVDLNGTVDLDDDDGNP